MILKKPNTTCTKPYNWITLHNNQPWYPTCLLHSWKIYSQIQQNRTTNLWQIPIHCPADVVKSYFTDLLCFRSFWKEWKRLQTPVGLRSCQVDFIPNLQSKISGSVPRYFKHWLKYPRASSGQIARLPNFSWMCSYSGTRMFCWEKGLKIRKKTFQKIAGNKKSRFWERIIIAPAGLERSLFICLLQGDFVETILIFKNNTRKHHLESVLLYIHPSSPRSTVVCPLTNAIILSPRCFHQKWLAALMPSPTNDQMDMRLSGLWHNSITTYKPELQLISTYASRPESIYIQNLKDRKYVPLPKAT